MTAIRLARVGMLAASLSVSCGGNGEVAPTGVPADASTYVGSGSGSGAIADGGDGNSDLPRPSTVAGCGSTTLLAVPDDPSAAGPWPVGVQTVTLPMTGGDRPVEIWYPAAPGSDSGHTPATYDAAAYLPDGQAAKIPPSANVNAECGCYRDLPLDTGHGPYPVVIFIHGTGSFRTASLSTMTQWASRGFVVVATDHAGLFLTDFLVTASFGDCTGGTGVHYGAQKLSADVDAMIAALTNKRGGFAFLGSTADMSRIAISGHSAGAGAAALFGGKPNVQVILPLADPGKAPPNTAALKSALIVSGMSDNVVKFSDDVSAYDGAATPIKRLIGITGADHLDVTDLCWRVNANGETGIRVASRYGVCGANLLAGLAKCGPLSPPLTGPNIVNYATTAALEETLHCQNRDGAFSALPSKYPEIGTFSHSP